MAFDLWLAFALASVLISLSPGAGAVNTMSNGMRYGVRASLPAILGLQLGYGAQIAIVGVGLGALLAQSATLFAVIKWAGVAYLLWLGYCKWCEPPLDMNAAEQGSESTSKRFWQAAFVNFTNPKATVFLVALFPQFLDLTAPQAPQLTAMGATLLVVDVMVMLGYASLARGLSRWMKSERHQRWQNRAFGGMFVGAAALMASYRGGQ